MTILDVIVFLAIACLFMWEARLSHAEKRDLVETIARMATGKGLKEDKQPKIGVEVPDKGTTAMEDADPSKVLEALRKEFPLPATPQGGEAPPGGQDDGMEE